MWRCRLQAAMVMKMKRRSSLDISVAESEAKLDASACHSLVGGVATSALMKLIRATIFQANSRTFAKLSGSKAFVFNRNHIDLHTQLCQFLYSPGKRDDRHLRLPPYTLYIHTHPPGRVGPLHTRTEKISTDHTPECEGWHTRMWRKWDTHRNVKVDAPDCEGSGTHTGMWRLTHPNVKEVGHTPECEGWHTRRWRKWDTHPNVKVDTPECEGSGTRTRMWRLTHPNVKEVGKHTRVWRGHTRMWLKKDHPHTPEFSIFLWSLFIHVDVVVCKTIVARLFGYLSLSAMLTLKKQTLKT
jgi:hypothetical protein